jgi:hypothetical protein
VVIASTSVASDVRTSGKPNIFRVDKELSITLERRKRHSARLSAGTAATRKSNADDPDLEPGAATDHDEDDFVLEGDLATTIKNVLESHGSRKGTSGLKERGL